MAANQPESISVKPAPDDSVTEQLKSATAELEKIKVFKFVSKLGTVFAGLGLSGVEAVLSDE